MKNVEKRLKRSMPWLRPILKVFHPSAQKDVSSSEKNAKLKEAEEKRSHAKAGSLSAKANMVKDFNDNKKK